VQAAAAVWTGADGLAESVEDGEDAQLVISTLVAAIPTATAATRRRCVCRAGVDSRMGKLSQVGCATWRGTQ